MRKSTYEVTITRVTTYEVKAYSTDDAINMALDDQGAEVDEVTTNVYAVDMSEV